MTHPAPPSVGGNIRAVKSEGDNRAIRVIVAPCIQWSSVIASPTTTQRLVGVAGRNLAGKMPIPIVTKSSRFLRLPLKWKSIAYTNWCVINAEKQLVLSYPNGSALAGTEPRVVAMVAVLSRLYRHRSEDSAKRHARPVWCVNVTGNRQQLTHRSKCCRGNPRRVDPTTNKKEANVGVSRVFITSQKTSAVSFYTGNTTVVCNSCWYTSF